MSDLSCLNPVQRAAAIDKGLKIDERWERKTRVTRFALRRIGEALDAEALRGGAEGFSTGRDKATEEATA